jgi:hypothetical protein
MLAVHVMGTLEIHFLFFRLNFVKVLIPHKGGLKKSIPLWGVIAIFHKNYLREIL